MVVCGNQLIIGVDGLKYEITHKRGIKGRKDRFVQCIFGCESDTIIISQIINYRTKKDITHKFNIKLI